MGFSDSELRALVEQVAVQVLKKHNLESAPRSSPQATPPPETGFPFGKKIVIFCEGPDLPGSIPPGGAVWEQGMQVDFAVLEGVEIASLSVASLGKLVHFIWETPFLQGIGEALVHGARVRVTDPSWKNVKPALAPLVEKGRSLGLKFEIGQEAAEMKFTQKVLTRDDVVGCHSKGIRTLIIPSGCIVTPLASEVAADRGMTLRKEGMR